MLKVSDVSAKYDKKPVLHQVNLTVEEGGLHGIIGLNGSGKTTLMRVISNEKKADGGAVFWKESRITRNEVAFLPTESFFYAKITGEEYLSLFSKRNPSFDFAALNELFDLPLGKLIEGYSTGMKKKIALMAIISLKKPLLLLDEPFNGLDLESNMHLKNIMMHLKESGHTLIVTSHILESLTGSCDAIHYLSEGNIKRTFHQEAFAEIEQEVATALKTQSETPLKNMWGE